MGPLTPIIGLRLLALAAGLRHNAEIGQPGLCFSAYGHKFGINHLAQGVEQLRLASSSSTVDVVAAPGSRPNQAEADRTGVGDFAGWHPRGRLLACAALAGGADRVRAAVEEVGGIRCKGEESPRKASVIKAPGREVVAQEGAGALVVPSAIAEKELPT